MRGAACNTLRGGANWWSVVMNIYAQAGLTVSIYYTVSQKNCADFFESLGKFPPMLILFDR